MLEFIKKLFCNHNYSIISQFVVQSEYDIVHESKRTPNTYCSMTRKHITVYKCDKCNKIWESIHKTNN